MKLIHSIARVILAIAFTSSVTAATLPNIKTPPAAAKTSVAPKIPTVKVPAVVKVPTAPKIPVVPKVVAAPKIPTVEAPPVVKIPSVKTPTIAKVPVAVKTPVVTKIPATTAAQPKVAAINTGRLNNLKQKVNIDASKVVTAGGRGTRFLNDNVGRAGAKTPGTFMDGIRQGSGGHDRNPLSGSPLDGMRGDKNSQVSHGGPQRNGAEAARGDSSSKESKNGNTITKWENGTVQVVSADKKTTTTAYPDGTVVETKNGKTTVYDPKGTPLPDDVGSSSGPTVVTKNDVRGFLARKNSTSEPAQDDTNSGGGPVNTGANGTGKSGSLSQPAGDFIENAGANLEAAREAIRIKIESKINTGGH